VQGQAQKAQERESVPDLVFGLVVGQRVEALQHQDLEHQHRIVRRPAAFGPVRTHERRLELASEQLEVDHQSQSFERIAGRRERRIAPIQIEEPRLARHRHLLATTSGTESRPALIR
jgi:hypothetical protein